MRRALAKAGLLSAVTLGALGVTAVPALAEGPAQTVNATFLTANTNPVNDGDNDTGKWGLAGLTGLLGLFGYKKYRDHRSANTRTTRDNDPGTGSTRH